MNVKRLMDRKEEKKEEGTRRRTRRRKERRGKRRKRRTSTAINNDNITCTADTSNRNEFSLSCKNKM